jgi:hypothetical protein
VSCPVNYGNRKVWAKSNDLICLLLQNRSTASTAAFTPTIHGNTRGARRQNSNRPPNCTFILIHSSRFDSIMRRSAAKRPRRHHRSSERDRAVVCLRIAAIDRQRCGGGSAGDNVARHEGEVLGKKIPTPRQRTRSSLRYCNTDARPR